MCICLPLYPVWQVSTYAFFHTPTMVGDEAHFMTRAMVDKFREAAGDPAWVQVGMLSVAAV